MGVDYRVLNLEIKKQSKTVLSKAKPLIKKEFDSKKAEMLNEFDGHEITLELKAGPNAKGQYFANEHGGNLFSFLGFQIGTDPTSELRKIIADSVSIDLNDLDITVKGDVIEIGAKVRVDSIGEINNKIESNQKLELPWTPRSFVDLIERGITGLNHYLFDPLRKFKNSFSTTAIQTDSTLRTGSFPKLRYVSEILGNFKKKISKK